MKTPSFRKLFSNPNFFKLWLSQSISLFVANVLNYALIVRVAESTGSNIAVGLLLFIYYLPTVMLGILAGAFVDRLSKRKIIIFTSLIQALVALSYLALENEVWPLFAILFFYSLIDEFLRPAGDSLLPQYVEEKLLPYANSVAVVSIQGSSYVGYLLAGPLMSLLGNGYVFLLSSCLLVVSAFFAFLMPVEKKEKSAREFLSDIKYLASEVEDSLHFIRENSLVFYAILLNSAFFFVLTTTVVLLPALSQKALNMDLRLAAPFFLLPAGLGFSLTSFKISLLMRLLSKRGTVMMGMALVSLSFIALGLVPTFGTTAVFITLPFVAFFCGVGAISIIVPARTVIQQRTPFSTYGRVFGVIRTLMAVASAVPMLFAAVLADVLGLMPVFFLLGAAILFSAIIVDRKFRIVDLDNLI